MPNNVERDTLTLLNLKNTLKQIKHGNLRKKSDSINCFSILVLNGFKFLKNFKEGNIVN